MASVVSSVLIIGQIFIRVIYVINKNEFFYESKNDYKSVTIYE